MMMGKSVFKVKCVPLGSFTGKYKNKSLNKKSSEVSG